MTPTQMDRACKAVALLCHHFEVTPEQLEGPKRFPELVLPRHMLMFYCTKIGIRSAETAAFCGRSRADVNHACKAVQNRLDTEHKIRELWQWLEGAI